MPPGTTIAVGGNSTFTAKALTIPGDLQGGFYNLILYVDDLEEVSEFNEINNKLIAVVPITVLSELLENGSFELPPVSSGWALFTNAQVPLWTFDWVACGETCPAQALLEIQTSGVVVTAQDGHQYVELDSDFGGEPGNQANLRLYRDFATCEGASYTLKYSWAKRTDADRMTVSWGGVEQATHGDATPIKVWYDETRQLEGDGTTLRLEFEEVGPADSLGMLLDAVSLVGPLCPPEEVVQ